MTEFKDLSPEEKTAAVRKKDAAKKTMVIRATLKGSLMAAAKISGTGYDLEELDVIFRLLCIPWGLKLTFEEVPS